MDSMATRNVDQVRQKGHEILRELTVQGEALSEHLIDAESLAKNLSWSIAKEGLHLFRIERLSFEKDYPRREAFENVISALNSPGFSFVYLLVGTGSEVEFYVGICRNNSAEKASDLDPSALRDNVLRHAFLGNFKGSRIGPGTTGLTFDHIDRQIYRHLEVCQRFSMVRGIPSLNKDTPNELASQFQGVDRLINVMQGHRYQVVIVCEPQPTSTINKIHEEVLASYSALQTASKVSIQVGSSVSETEGTQESTARQNGGSQSTSSGGHEDNKTQATQFSTTTTTGTNGSRGDTRSVNLSHEDHDKRPAELLRYIDDELLRRLRLGRSKGLYSTAVYLASQDQASQMLLENSIKSLFQGNQSTLNPLRIQRFAEGQNAEKTKENIRSLIRNFRVFADEGLSASPSALTLLSVGERGNHPSLGTLLTADELSLLAGLPQREVAGVSLQEEVDFGLNLPSDEAGPTIDLGHMLQGGYQLHDRKVRLPIESLTKHLFIAGVTGSGKTTTCQKILLESNLPFLVIEPAKTEYRRLVSLPGLNVQVFTLGNESMAPFRFNPFEFLPSETITGHVDMLKAAFTSAFDMEAAIPQIMEQALYQVYEDFGWNLVTNKNMYDPEDGLAWNLSGEFFPTLSDYVGTVERVVESLGFDERLKRDYLGSIRGRVNSLLSGTKGQMLNVRRSVDFRDLIKQKVILEFEDLKAGEDKSFLMALILSRVAEAIKEVHAKERSFRHVTLIEEAHRLLSKPRAGEDATRQRGVEVFTDMLAEVRKYGESLIIVDQIPGKLTPEVLKNTNTKIIHRIFAQDDKDALGESMALDDGQRDFLSYLAAGEAIVFTQGWNKPIYVRIEKGTDTSEADPDPEEIRIRASNFWLTRQRDFIPELKERTLATGQELLQVSALLQETRRLLRGYSIRNPQPQAEALLRRTVAHLDQCLGSKESTELLVGALLVLANGAAAIKQQSKPEDYAQVARSVVVAIRGQEKLEFADFGFAERSLKDL